MLENFEKDLNPELVGRAEREVRVAHELSAEHHCVGAPLTRQEMNIAFKILFERMKNFRFAEGKNDFQHQGNFMVRALKHLHVTFEKR